MNSAEKVAEICSDLEPMKAFSATPDETRGVEITALHSIAISLKRIADKLELSQKQPVMMSAEEATQFFKPKTSGGFFE